jgi:hypothetical protein
MSSPSSSSSPERKRISADKARGRFVSLFSVDALLGFLLVTKRTSTSLVAAVFSPPETTRGIDHLKKTHRITARENSEASRTMAGEGADGAATTTAKNSTSTSTTHHGSCHCGAVRFEVDAPRVLRAVECNCAFCFSV